MQFRDLMSVGGVPDGYTLGYTLAMRDHEPTKALMEAAGVAFVMTVGIIASIWFFWTNTVW